MASRLADDRGSATVAAAFACLAITAFVALIVYLGAAMSARHRAQAAADLAALAAAGAATDQCAAASTIAGAMDASVARCTIDGADAVVQTRITVRLGMFGIKTAQAAARAGPAD
ncbi:Rv3654c family TadE-like protein [Jongsikchunia kroppenstedtii]|uniref:Rv3654c family TadE-like protein n=1 Tax=Jongsikchunia kroppenstedtii TaxID=1121721 RepID=UPI000379C4ED|nr:Rv3654c family TadE-like protein [Jongsikchunia kroppenstedtii]